MARTYSSIPVLSKIKIGNSTYYLKDADARGILDSINSDVYSLLQVAPGTVAGGGSALVTASDVKSYVDSAVEAALEIVVLQSLPTANAEAYATYHNSIVLVPAQGGSGTNVKDEYIILRSGEEGSYTYAWEQIGSTEIDLSGYVTDVKYIDASHKLQQQKDGSYTDIHTFGDFADVDKGTATLSDYVTGVSSAKVTAAGALEKDATNGVQIEGSVSAVSGVITVEGTLPSKAADSFTANTPTAIDVSKFNGGSAASLGNGFYTAGTAASKAADTFTANTPTAIDVSKFNGGSAASLSSGFYTAGSAASKAADSFTANTPTAIDVTKFSGGSKAADSFTAASIASKPTSAFAQEGVVASVGTGDDAETLILTAAGTANAVTDVTINGGSFTEGAFTPASLASGFYTAGSAASFTEGAFTPNTPTAIDTSKFNGGSAASLSAGFYTPGSAAQFTEGAFTPNTPAAIDVSQFDGGSAASLGNGFYTAGSAASFSEGAFSAGSLPTIGSVTPTFTGSKYKFTGSEVDANVTLSTGSKVIEVLPDDEA